MDFQEYPKALYQGDDARTVADAIEEAQARRDGFGDWRPAAEAGNDDVPRRGRKAKASE